MCICVCVCLCIVHTCSTHTHNSNIHVAFVPCDAGNIHQTPLRTPPEPTEPGTHMHMYVHSSIYISRKQICTCTHAQVVILARSSSTHAQEQPSCMYAALVHSQLLESRELHARFGGFCSVRLLSSWLLCASSFHVLCVGRFFTLLK
jgi:hypothetical protein